MYIMITIVLLIIILAFSPFNISHSSAKQMKDMYSKEYYENEEKIIEKSETNNLGDFIIYYDNLNDSRIEKLSNYDVVIIEPRNATKKQILKLKISGVKVLGYTSIVEQNENNMEFISLKDSWFYKPDGDKVIEEQWQSWYMDIRNKGYQNFLFEQIHLHIVNKELDGVFLDTVGDIDDSNWNETDKNEMREKYTKFLKRIRKNYKDLEIVQNWGFYTAKNYSYELIDGLMWEGFSFDLLDKDEWSQNKYKEIEQMNLDFFIVAPSKQEEVKCLINNKTYIYVRDKDVYDDLN